MRRYLLVGIIEILALLYIAARPAMPQPPAIIIQPLGSLCRITPAFPGLAIDP
jgi:hypothetical protein